MEWIKYIYWNLRYHKLIKNNWRILTIEIIYSKFISYIWIVFTKFFVRCVFDSSSACSRTPIICNKLVGSVWKIISLFRSFLGSFVLIFWRRLSLFWWSSSESTNSFIDIMGTAWAIRQRDAIYMHINKLFGRIDKYIC